MPTLSSKFQKLKKHFALIAKIFSFVILPIARWGWKKYQAKGRPIVKEQKHEVIDVTGTEVKDEVSSR